MKLPKIALAEDKNKQICSSCTLYFVLFLLIFPINFGIGTYFVYYECMNRNKETGAKYGHIYQTTI